MLGKATDDGKRLQACLKRLELLLKAKPKGRGFGGNGPPGAGWPTDDGKRVRACSKRLKLHSKAKPKEGGLGGGTGKPGQANGFQCHRRSFRSKIAQKSSQKLSCFLIVLGSVLGPILEHFGTPKSTKIGPS